MSGVLALLLLLALITAPARAPSSRSIPNDLRSRKPPANQADGAARSEFDRAARSPAPSAPAISAPPPTLPSKTPTRPQLLLNSAVLDRLGALAIYLRSEKRWFKIPIHSDRVDDEGGCDACARAMGAFVPSRTTSAATTSSRGCGRIGSAERGVACIA